MSILALMDKTKFGMCEPLPWSSKDTNLNGLQIVVFFSFRITSTVQKMEKRLKVRWNKTNKNYNKNLSTAKEKRRMSVLVKLQRNSAERHFLLNLIRKYASK